MMIIKRGDTTPPLVMDLSGSSTVDLTSATVRVIGVRDGLVIIDRIVTGTDQGVVTMPWQPEETALPGAIGFEVEVEWPDGAKQTFPPGGLEWVRVVPDTDQLPTGNPLGLIPVPGYPGYYTLPA